MTSSEHAAFDHDLVIVGMGSAGMAAAEYAVSLGLNAIAVERDRIGGNGLWNASVPTKALLASARAARTLRTAARFGLPESDAPIDLTAVWRSIAAVQEEIAANHDAPARFAAMGVELVAGSARVTGPNEVTVDIDEGTRAITASFVLLCPGSRPAVPPIAGLEECGFLTSETLFALDRPPAALVIVGGGPVGVELSQALNRLGVRVTLVTDSPTVLPRDEPSLVAMLQRRLVDEGVEICSHVEVVSVERGADGRVTVRGTERSWNADEVLVATGRVVNADDLGLEALGIPVRSGGVETDDRGRTVVKSIYAAGDVTGTYLFGHAAAAEAIVSLRDAFFPGRSTPVGNVAWCTFTDPEFAHAGLTIAEAEQRHGDDVEVWRIDLAESDRARIERDHDGAIVIVTARGRIVGAHVLAPNAGELVHELALAIDKEMRLTDLAAVAHVYPTLATSIGQLAVEAASERAQKLRWLVRRG